MSIVKTEAFVLKSFKYGDTSKIVTLFTKDHGKMNAIVKGARNYRSRICGTLETMNYINAVIYLKNNRELQLLSNAEFMTSFGNILIDLDKLQAGYKIIEIINKSTIEHEVNQVIFRLLVDTYTSLNSSTRNYNLYVLYFQMRLTEIMGLNPDFSNLKGEEETLYKNNEFQVSKSLLKSLRLITEQKLDSIESMNIDNKIQIDLISSYEKYLSSHTHGFKFYNSTKVFQEINH